MLGQLSDHIFIYFAVKYLTNNWNVFLWCGFICKKGEIIGDYTDRIKEANITKDDIVISLDESTFKIGIKTKKGIYLDLPDKKNDKK